MKKILFIAIAIMVIIALVMVMNTMSGSEGNIGDTGLTLIESDEPAAPDEPVVTAGSETPQEPVVTEGPVVSNDPVITESWSCDEDSIAYRYDLPQWTENAWIELNGNMPEFTDEEKKNRTAFENYSELDGLGRCGVAFANICRELMPTEKRGSISEVHPTGWKQAFYPELIVEENLFSRSHLIAFQLAGENANKQNLITGTMYFNAYGMIDFEEEVGDYVRANGGHVLYRVTPDFWGDELVARGAQMEAWSVEDGGKSICYNVYVYNVQPGISIDYATGASCEDEAYITALQDGVEEPMEYVLNTSSMKFHLPTCSTLGDIKSSNKETYFGYRSHLILLGYVPCKGCEP